MYYLTEKDEKAGIKNERFGYFRMHSVQAAQLFHHQE
jgi:hypothetical protein